MDPNGLKPLVQQKENFSTLTITCKSVQLMKLARYIISNLNVTFAWVDTNFVWVKIPI
jgi:hypothetical protein